MNEAFEHLMAPIDRYEGTLARLMGDAIFALFGAPIAHEDDPQRAVSAGLAIVDAIRAYRGTIAGDLDLNVRVGINTGPVVVGEVGSDLRVEYTAMGDAVNVAARMEQTAEPGTVQITAETARLVAAVFDLGPPKASRSRARRSRSSRISCWGGSRPPRRRTVGCARDAARRTRRRDGDAAASGRRDARGSRGDGRADRRARSGEEPSDRGDARLLVDPPTAGRPRRPTTSAGSGRSGSASRSTRRAPTRSTGGCSRRSPASPTRIRRTSSGTSSRRRSNRGRPSGSSRTCACGVRSSACPSPTRSRSRARRSGPRSWISSRGRPAYFGADPRLLVFEDLHWCDEASMDLLIETAKIVDELPCLFLFAFRPDRQAPSWRLKRWLETEHAALGRPRSSSRRCPRRTAAA